MNEPNTFFILGYPRSGTTWFANLFNAHPDVEYRHEFIGRCYERFPAELFRRLKHDHGLSDEDYARAIRVILSPNVESDRAPFFPKNHLAIGNPRIHYLAWLLTKAVPLLGPVYSRVFFPRSPDVHLAVKETRSSVDMDSILKGLRARHLLILFRHPCGALASVLTGISQGKMSGSTRQGRLNWYRGNAGKPYVKELGLTPDTLEGLSEHEYRAITWRVQNEDYLDFDDSHFRKVYINYETFMANPREMVGRLFETLALGCDPAVEAFIDASSGSESARPVLKDSSSTFYSVYRDGSFDPERWKKTLDNAVIADIERHTLGVYEKLLEVSMRAE